MKTLIFIHSYHHNNTLKVAKAMAGVLKSDVKYVIEAKTTDLEEYDLVGFGAGIDSCKHYKELLDFADSIIAGEYSKKCFIFSTSAVQGKSKIAEDHLALREILLEKKYKVLGEFSCKGFNTNSLLKFIGGMNKKHPDKMDIKNAREFAIDLLSRI